MDAPSGQLHIEYSSSCLLLPSLAILPSGQPVNGLGLGSTHAHTRCVHLNLTAPSPALFLRSTHVQFIVLQAVTVGGAGQAPSAVRQECASITAASFACARRSGLMELICCAVIKCVCVRGGARRGGLLLRGRRGGLLSSRRGMTDDSGDPPS